MSARVSFLILANLGLVACGSKEPTPPATPDTPLVVGTGSASGAPTVSAPPPLASAAPSAAPSVDPPDDPPAPSTGGTNNGKSCQTNSDCGTGGQYFCKIATGKKQGTCTVHFTRGRPLVVDGVSHTAPYAGSSEMLDTVHEEHASIAAFARTIAELMSLGAPLWLLEETSGALSDEIRHTERALTLLGDSHRIAPLEAATLPLKRSIEDFFRDVFRGGAVGETMAATEAEIARQQTSDPELRAFYEMIVNDESRHAALAFKTLRWLLTKQPSLASVLEEERAQLKGEARLIVAPLLASAL